MLDRDCSFTYSMHMSLRSTKKQSLEGMYMMSTTSGALVTVKPPEEAPSFEETR